MSKRKAYGISSDTVTRGCPSGTGAVSDPVYSRFLQRLQTRFKMNLELGDGVLFRTEPRTSLFNLYINNFVHGLQQHYRCHCCHEFLRQYGNLAVIDASGTLYPAIWHPDDAVGDQCVPVEALYDRIRNSSVKSVFFSDQTIWGRPESGGWRHLAVVPPPEIVSQDRLNSPSQLMAKSMEDFKNLTNSINEWERHTIEKAIALFESDAFARGDRMAERAKFLLQAFNVRGNVNAIWKMVAMAPVGFCNVRSSVIATVLDDVRSNLDFDTIKRKYNEKMHPLQYQRPQAAPAAGNVKRAEDIFNKLGLVKALDRRIARIEEVRPFWSSPLARRLDKPTSVQSPVFGELPVKPSLATANIPSGQVVQPGEHRTTWAAFYRDVLPRTVKIELFLTMSKMNWIVYTTAVDSNSPPILSWDSMENRNPVSCYVWHGGSPASQFGKAPGWADVVALTTSPQSWTSPAPNHSIVFLVDGARETQNSGAAIFPENLRSELHEVRSTIEGYSQKAYMRGLSEGSAVGVGFHSKAKMELKLRVTTDNLVKVYILDRWE